MNKINTTSNRVTAEKLIMKDIMNVLIAEQFFMIDEHTTQSLASALREVQNLHHHSGDDQTLVYMNELCFLIEKSYRQGYQWVSNSSIYKKENHEWVKISCPIELSQYMLSHTLTKEAYAHPGVADFLDTVKVSIEQLTLSLGVVEDVQAMTPKSPYDWHVKGEMIASVRDRPFHPVAKAKVGFTSEDYQNYMAEFGKKSTLHWVAVCNDSVIKGCPEGEVQPLDVLNDPCKAMIEKELVIKKIPKEKYTIIPVHPWQLKNIILPNFKKEIEEKTIIILDSQAGDILSTSSVRSLAFPYKSTKMLKLPMSVKSLGAARYLPVVKLLNGIAGEKMLRQAIACDETLVDRVFLCEEKYWWGYMPQSMGLFDDHPRHLAAQLRIYPQEMMKDAYKIITMSSLGVVVCEDHFLTEILGEHISKEDVIDFYTDVVTTFYDITMRLFKIGVVPEIHGQNCCLVLKDNEVAGILFRDHDSVRLHQPYLDKHQIKDPGYHIRPGYSNSLYNETIEKLIFYVQSLGTQVNLASIMESLSEVYDIPVKIFWQMTETKLKVALQSIDIPETDRKVLHDVLFERKEWPVKLMIRPLLEADGVPGAMPSGKGVGFNPFYFLS